MSKSNSLHLIALPVFTALLLLALGMTVRTEAAPVDAPAGSASVAIEPAIENATIPISATVYLPIVSARLWPAAKIGADVGHMTTFPATVGIGYPLIQQMGGDWLRVWLPWANVETAPGVYDWSVFDPVFAQIDALGMSAMVLLYKAPTWAADEACGPITNGPALASFTTTLVTRYHDVAAAWEFINEPDGWRPHPYGPVIGCWGNDGAAYAESLALFERTVKQVDPDALVFFGGLAYDAWENFNRDFFSDALAAGAGDSFDGLSFHFYPINRAEFPSVRDKLQELQGIMADHGVSGKLLWITETSMWANSDGGLDAQRNYIVKELTRAYCAGADNTFWFAITQDAGISDPLHRWLIDPDHNLINAHDTFTHYAGRIKDGYCFGPMADLPPEVEAYQFDTANGPVVIAWTNADPAMLLIPTDESAAESRLLLDREGQLLETITPAAGQITMPLEAKPRFLVKIRGATSCGPFECRND